MEKWAAVDIGSNTVQLLVAESGDDHFRPHFFALRTTRLGAVREPGLLDPARVADTLAVLQEYRGIAARQGARAARVIATSAVRDAMNRELLLQEAHRLTGWHIEVLSGQEEARLSFLGAAAQAVAAGAGQILLIDIGGSSSELIRWQQGNMAAVSADMGAVRAHVAGWDEAEITKRLAPLVKPADDDAAALVVGAGGTITTAAALLQGCREYSREAVEGYTLTLAQVKQLLAELRPLSIKQRCAFSPLLERRGEIIYEGLLILRAFYRLLRLPSLSVSTGGVLEGCLLDMKQTGAIKNKMEEA